MQPTFGKPSVSNPNLFKRLLLSHASGDAINPFKAPYQDCKLRRNMIRGFQISRLALIACPLESLGESQARGAEGIPQPLGGLVSSRSLEQDLASSV